MFHQAIKFFSPSNHKPIDPTLHDIETPSISLWSTNQLKAHLQELQKKNRPVAPNTRVDLVKMMLLQDALHPERVESELIRVLWDYDLNYAKQCLLHWDEKKELADLALSSIDTFFSSIQMPLELSFQQHAYYAFCLSALMSGVKPDCLENEYKKPLKTMVYGVVSPTENWSIKSELEQQLNPILYVAHISKTGLIKIEDINDMTTFRLNENSPFYGVRMFAVSCGARQSFDGVYEMDVDGIKRDVRSLEVLKHDFIHAGFLRRHHEKNSDDFLDRFRLLGLMYEFIQDDETLLKDEVLLKKVQLAWFFFTHEFTTSVFLDGIPNKLPKMHLRSGGSYALQPQLYLQLASKLRIVSDLFKNEVEVEKDFFSSLKLDLKLKPDDSDSVVISKINKALHPGYEYLDDRFCKFFDRESSSKTWLGGTLEREFHRAFKS